MQNGDNSGTQLGNRKRTLSEEESETGSIMHEGETHASEDEEGGDEPEQQKKKKNLRGSSDQSQSGGT
jgi:hypothetical protein